MVGSDPLPLPSTGQVVVRNRKVGVGEVESGGQGGLNCLELLYKVTHWQYYGHMTRASVGSAHPCVFANDINGTGHT